MQTKDAEGIPLLLAATGRKNHSAPMVHKPLILLLKKIHIFEIADQNQ